MLTKQRVYFTSLVAYLALSSFSSTARTSMEHDTQAARRTHADGSTDDSPRKVVLIFSGLFGHKNNCKLIAERLTQQGFQCIFIAHQRYPYLNFYAMLDDWTMALARKRLGISAIDSQAKHAYHRLKGLLRKNDQIYLIGHSQGGIVGLEFWRRYRHLYTIKAMTIIASPLQGALYVQSIANFRTLYRAQQRGRAEGVRVRRYFFHFWPYCRGLILRALGPILTPGITDLRPYSAAIFKLGEVYAQMSQAQFPMLIVKAHCNAYPKMIQAVFGKTGASYLVSRDTEDDGIVATASQGPNASWPQLQILTVKAMHNVVIAPLSKDPDVCIHPEVIDQTIALFCKPS